ncbi:MULTISPECIES: hypothetical protein [unclassified Agarivorans]|uniref:hypothetical protein n=1 Tax=unclassified Agarivorans TaxID=2636026 RepID=UPI0026E127BC|nr:MULTISPECIES: hypothetical protein [unclassified Agarivorans]MDO6686583.1 hypothetical protein [Agarivorans sp. 3_MG-2023]MDO6715401.1 hypothetical protein [Agarivorans sp. 2_MG-2023]
MLAVIKTAMLFIGLSFILPLSAADNDTEAAKLAPPQLNMQLNVEVVGIEQAALQASQALSDIAASIDQLAANPEMSEQQQQQFERAFLAVEQLSTQLDTSLKQLPNTVSQSTKPVIKLADELSGNIQRWVVIILAALVVIIIVALVAIYFTVLAPTSRAVITATSQLNQLASSLKVTAQLVEQTSAQNQSLLLRLELPKTPRFKQRHIRQ